MLTETQSLIPMTETEEKKNMLGREKEDGCKNYGQMQIEIDNHHAADFEQDTMPKIISLEEVPKYSNLFISVYPFIQHGYRIHHTCKDCLHSLFAWHNETMNIWTHLLPFFGFIILLICVISSQAIILKNGGIIYLYLFTSIVLFLFSTIYHTFNCHSLEVSQCCYKLDLTAIMFELMGGTICSIYFMFHEFESIKRTYILIFVGLGLITVIMSTFDFIVSAKLNMFLMMLYASLFLISFLSSIHWVAIANMKEVEMLSGYVLCGFLSIFIGFLFFLAKFPECWIQSKIIDYYCHSHVIWHLSCLGCAICYYIMMYHYYQLLLNNQRI